MFTLQRTRYGVTYPLPAIFINDAESEHLEANVKIQAYGVAELDVLGIGCTAKFIEDVSEDEYNFPLQSSDFSSERVGTLSFLITDTLTDGLYLASLVVEKTVLGVFGGGAFGTIQGGAKTTLYAKLSTYLQIQQLSDTYTETTPRPALPYSVPVVTRWH